MKDLITLSLAFTIGLNH